MHRLPQVGGQAGDEGGVGRGHLVDEGDEAAVAVRGALVEGVLADHVGGGQQEELRLGVAQVGDAALVGEGRGGASVRTGAVTLARSGRLRVPENFDMASLLSGVSVGRSGQGTGRTSGAESNGGRTVARGAPHQEGSPSFAADRVIEPAWEPGGGGRSALPLSYAGMDRAAGLEPATLDYEGTPACAAGRLETAEHRQLQMASMGCEARVRTRTSWFRARRGSSSTTSHCGSVWTGETRTPTPGSPTPVRSHCATSRLWLVLTVGFEPTLTAV